MKSSHPDINAGQGRKITSTGHTSMPEIPMRVNWNGTNPVDSIACGNKRGVDYSNRIGSMPAVATNIIGAIANGP